MTDFELADYNLAELEQRNPQISRKSHWNDDTWYVDGDSPGYRPSASAIHWTIDAPQWLMNGLKYVAAILFIGRRGSKAYKHSTASTFSAGARHLARFAKKHDLRGFSQFDEDTFELFKRDIHCDLLAEQFSVEDGEAELDATDDAYPLAIASNIEDPASYSAAYYRLRTWKLLCEHGDLLKLAGILPVPFNPFSETTPRKMAEAISSSVIEEVPALPDEIAMPILNLAHRLIGQPADDVLRLQDAYLGTMSRIDREPPTAEREKLRRVLEDFEFSTMSERDGEPWRDQIVLPPDEPGGGRVLRRLVRDIRDACILVILSDTGMRIGEVCSPRLTAGEAGEKLPSCIELEVSKTELNEHFFLRGALVKHQERPKDERWLLGARPVGSNVEPPTVRAIHVLQRLLEPWRRLAKGDAAEVLLIDFLGGGLPRSAKAVVPLTASRLRLSMQGFIADQITFAPMLDKVSERSDLYPYVISNGRCIRPHQWRKTFLRYLMRVDDGLLPAISQHFKHLSLAITEDGYMPKDAALIEAADSVRTRETALYFFERRNGKNRQPGRLDEVIAKSQDDIDALIGDRSLETAVPDLERFVREHDLVIWKAPHGQCMIALSPDEARCRHGEDKRPAFRRSPDFARRTPSMCAGCANFSADAGTIEFWRKRFADNHKAWLASGRHPAFRVAEARARQAAAILRALSPDADEWLEAVQSNRQDEERQ